jgi:3-hydroxyisobutyrate dehydrogenase-like beta-hydroxyacid dehydrogenase
MGDSGTGQLTKMVNQICIASLIQGLAEGINFSEKAGLDTKGVVEVISKGAAQSWQMDNRWETMLSGEYEHGFAVDWMRKDLGIAIKEAENNRANIDTTKTIDQYYQEVQAMGGSKWDTSSLLKRLQVD